MNGVEKINPFAACVNPACSNCQTYPNPEEIVVNKDAQINSFPTTSKNYILLYIN